MNTVKRLRDSLSQGELDSMVAHLVRCPELMKSALGKIKSDFFREDIEFAHKLVFAVATEFFEKHNVLPSRPVIETELNARLDQSVYKDSHHIRESVMSLVTVIFLWEDKDLMPSFARNTINTFTWERGIGNILIDGVEKGAIGTGLIESLPLLQRQLSISDAKSVNPFGTSGAVIGVQPRSKTNIPWLDALMGGGPQIGGAYGFLAASGGGKTTLGNQIAIEHARIHKHVLFFSYEQSLTPDFFVPVYAFATKLPRARFEAMREDSNICEQLTPDELDKYMKARESITNYLTYYDMSMSASGVREIETHIERNASEGKPVSMIVVDWLWPLVTRSYMTLDNSMTRRMDIRIYGQIVIDELRQMCLRHRIWCWLNHQISPAVAASKKKGFTFEDAAEMKSFAWYLNGCFCLDKFDTNKRAKLIYAKGRSEATGEKTVKLLGEIATFVGEGGDFDRDEVSGRLIPKERRGVIPDAEGNYNESVQASANAKKYGLEGI